MVKLLGQHVPVKTVLLMVSESLLLMLALMASIVLRFGDFNALREFLSTPAMAGRFALVVVVCELALYYNDLYNFRAVVRRSDLFVHLLQALGAACLLLALVYYVQPSLTLGRGIAAIAAITIMVTLLSWRLILDATGVLSRQSHRMLIVGTDQVGIRLAQEAISRPELNIKVAGFLDEEGKNIGQSLVNPGIIGAISDMEKIVRDQKIDRLILSLAERRGRTPLNQLLRLKFAGVAVEDGHSCYERIAGRIVLEHL